MSTPREKVADLISLVNHGLLEYEMDCTYLSPIKNATYSLVCQRAIVTAFDMRK